MSRTKPSPRLARFLFVVGLALAGLGSYGAYQSAEASKLPQVDGTIVDSSMTVFETTSSRSGSSGSESTTSTRAATHVRYRYRVRDRELLSEQIEVADLGMQNSAAAREMKGTLPRRKRGPRLV